jgi:hypothetical protein
LDETAPQEQLTQQVTRLREYMLSQAIDQALATP